MAGDRRSHSRQSWLRIAWHSNVVNILLYGTGFEWFERYLRRPVLTGLSIALKNVLELGNLPWRKSVFWN